MGSLKTRLGRYLVSVQGVMADVTVVVIIILQAVHRSYVCKILLMANDGDVSSQQ